VQVTLFVCGSCAALRERRWLCDLLEHQRSAREDGLDAPGAEYFERLLHHHRSTIHSIDDTIVDLMLDRLRSPLFQDLLERAACQQGQASSEESLLKLEQLQMLLGPTFKALRETILADQSRERQRLGHLHSSRIESFLGTCARCGVKHEYAEILARLPLESLDELETQLTSTNDSFAASGRQGYNARIETVVLTAISSMFLQARTTPRP
jgi:hypothetical protein